jgi:hypothetical protein
LISEGWPWVSIDIYSQGKQANQAAPAELYAAEIEQTPIKKIRSSLDFVQDFGIVI